MVDVTWKIDFLLNKSHSQISKEVTVSLAIPAVSNNNIRTPYSIYNLDPEIRKLSNDKLLHSLLYGSKLYSFEINREIIKVTVKFLKLSKRFERPLLWLVFPLPPYHLHTKLFYQIFDNF